MAANAAVELDGKTVNQDGPCWPFSAPEVGAGPSCRAIV